MFHYTVCRSDEILFGDQCIHLVNDPEVISSPSNTCNGRRSSRQPQGMNLDIGFGISKSAALFMEMNPETDESAMLYASSIENEHYCWLLGGDLKERSSRHICQDKAMVICFRQGKSHIFVSRVILKILNAAGYYIVKVGLFFNWHESKYSSIKQCFLHAFQCHVHLEVFRLTGSQAAYFRIIQSQN